MKLGAVDRCCLQRPGMLRESWAGKDTSRTVFHLPPAQPHLAMENVTQRKLVTGGVCVGDSMLGATGEGGSWIWGEVGVQVLHSPCLHLLESFHFSKAEQAGLRKMSPSLRGYSQLFSAQWFEQPAFFVHLLCAKTQLQGSPFPSIRCSGMDRHPMGNSIQQGHLEAQIVSTMRKTGSSSQGLRPKKCLCLPNLR